MLLRWFHLPLKGRSAARPGGDRSGSLADARPASFPGAPAGSAAASLRLCLLLTLLPSCGPGDDAGAPPSRSTEDASSPASNGEAASPQARQAGPALTGERVRVVFLGTSLTAGLGLLRDSERFTDVLQAMADSAGLAVEVVNAGVSGDTSAGGLRRLDWLLAEPLDVLVVELGANDGLRGLPVEALKENLREVVRATRARHPLARVAIVEMQAPPNLGEIYTSDFREAFEEVAREESATLWPFLLEGVAGVPALNQEDRIHPSPEGHQQIARTLWPHLQELIREVEEGQR